MRVGDEEKGKHTKSFEDLGAELVEAFFELYVVPLGTRFVCCYGTIRRLAFFSLGLCIEINNLPIEPIQSLLHTCEKHCRKLWEKLPRCAFSVCFARVKREPIAKKGHDTYDKRIQNLRTSWLHRQALTHRRWHSGGSSTA